MAAADEPAPAAYVPLDVAICEAALNRVAADIAAVRTALPRGWTAQDCDAMELAHRDSMIELISLQLHHRHKFYRRSPDVHFPYVASCMSARVGALTNQANDTHARLQLHITGVAAEQSGMLRRRRPDELTNLLTDYARMAALDEQRRRSALPPQQTQ